MYFETIVPVIVAFLIVTASPGPANIAAAVVSMQNGRHAGLVFGLGLATGLAFWGIIAATGLGVILESSARLLFTLKCAGGLYLLWLAYQSWQSATSTNASSNSTTVHDRWFWRGLMLNLSNPKAVFAWMAALSMGLGGPIGDASILMPTATCMLLGVVNYSIYALAFSMSGVMERYQSARVWVDSIVAGLFSIAGVSLIRSAFSR